MNVILKAWRNFKLVVSKRRQKIGVENKFQIGDFVNIKGDTGWRDNGEFYFGETGEVVDAVYGFNMNTGWRWYYKVSYKKKDTVIVLYEEQEICIDAAWIRADRLKKLGI